MSTLTKSPIRVAREALAVATKALRPYAPKYSPQLYTQPQLFVCLVLKVYFKTDYRGVIPYLREWSELRRTIGLRCVPHFTTLHKASNRLLRVRRFRRLLRATLRSVRRAAFDSTGLDCGYRSASDIRRRSATRKTSDACLCRAWKCELPSQGGRLFFSNSEGFLQSTAEAV